MNWWERSACSTYKDYNRHLNSFEEAAYRADIGSYSTPEYANNHPNLGDIMFGSGDEMVVKRSSMAK